MDNQPDTNKALGQHWLHDLPALNDITNAAMLSNRDTVLEIGPGPGALTAILCANVNTVIAVEFDRQLAADLPKRVPATNLEVVQQDILKFDFNQLPKDYKIVANIPYYLTSNLIRVISETPNQPLTAVLLIQKEVAERVAAAPGDMSILSVTAQYYWQVSLGIVLPAELFTPPPKVDSQVLILKRRETPLYGDIDTKLLFRIVKAGFAQRRKTLLNSLGSGLHLNRTQTLELCKQANIDPNQRAQSLNIEDWYNLYLALI